jgi:hypothetical protein
LKKGSARKNHQTEMSGNRGDAVPQAIFSETLKEMMPTETSARVWGERVLSSPDEKIKEGCSLPEAKKQVRDIANRKGSIEGAKITTEQAGLSGKKGTTEDLQQDQHTKSETSEERTNQGIIPGMAVVESREVKGNQKYYEVNEDKIPHMSCVGKSRRDFVFTGSEKDLDTADAHDASVRKIFTFHKNAPAHVQENVQKESESQTVPVAGANTESADVLEELGRKVLQVNLSGTISEESPIPDGFSSNVIRPHSPQPATGNVLATEFHKYAPDRANAQKVSERQMVPSEVAAVEPASDSEDSGQKNVDAVSAAHKLENIKKDNLTNAIFRPEAEIHVKERGGSAFLNTAGEDVNDNLPVVREKADIRAHHPNRTGETSANAPQTSIGGGEVKGAGALADSDDKSGAGEYGETSDFRKGMLKKEEINKDEATVKVRHLSRENNSSLKELPDPIYGTQSGEVEKSFARVLKSVAVDASQPQGMMDRIAESSDVLMREGYGRVKLTLAPPQLGALDLDLRVTGDRISMVLTAENSEVCKILNSNMEQLKNTLQAQGLNIDRLDVLVQERGDRGYDPYRGEKSFGRESSGQRSEEGSRGNLHAISLKESYRGTSGGEEGFSVFA